MDNSRTKTAFILSIISLASVGTYLSLRSIEGILGIGFLTSNSLILFAAILLLCVSSLVLGIVALTMKTDSSPIENRTIPLLTRIFAISSIATSGLIITVTVLLGRLFRF